MSTQQIVKMIKELDISRIHISTDLDDKFQVILEWFDELTAKGKYDKQVFANEDLDSALHEAYLFATNLETVKLLRNS